MKEVPNLNLLGELVSMKYNCISWEPQKRQQNWYYSGMSIIASNSHTILLKHLLEKCN